MEAIIAMGAVCIASLVCLHLLYKSALQENGRISTEAIHCVKAQSLEEKVQADAVAKALEENGPAKHPVIEDPLPANLGKLRELESQIAAMNKNTESDFEVLY
jgi:hypothetical protein